MRKTALLLISMAALAAVAFAAPVNSQKIGTVSLDGWENMITTLTSSSVYGGSPELKTDDGRFFAKSAKMNVQIFQKAKKGQKPPVGVGAIKYAEFSGNVSFSAKLQDGRSIKGGGAKLTIIGAEQKAVLDGNGKIVQVEAMDPVQSPKPIVAQGEIIEVNLKPNLTPDDWRIKAHSSADKSHFSFTPKPKNESK